MQRKARRLDEDTYTNELQWGPITVKGDTPPLPAEYSSVIKEYLRDT
jgi:hypothetical protein